MPCPLLPEEEQSLVEFYRRLESKQCKQEILISITAMIHAQEALKADYDLADQPAQEEANV
ncbi:MAG: hypothetical protein LBC99_06515 [Spirochaetota bacterium]|nr:hypothetical protein [Spirochaetota bacterium]